MECEIALDIADRWQSLARSTAPGLDSLNSELWLDVLNKLPYAAKVDLGTIKEYLKSVANHLFYKGKKIPTV